jgi:hypothetical protein
MASFDLVRLVCNDKPHCARVGNLMCRFGPFRRERAVVKVVLGATVRPSGLAGLHPSRGHERVNGALIERDATVEQAETDWAAVTVDSDLASLAQGQSNVLELSPRPGGWGSAR